MVNSCYIEEWFFLMGMVFILTFVIIWINYNKTDIKHIKREKPTWKQSWETKRRTKK